MGGLHHSLLKHLWFHKFNSPVCFYIKQEVKCKQNISHTHFVFAYRHGNAAVRVPFPGDPVVQLASPTPPSVLVLQVVIQVRELDGRSSVVHILTVTVPSQVFQMFWYNSSHVEEPSIHCSQDVRESLFTDV